MACLNLGAYNNSTGNALGWSELAAIDLVENGIFWNKKVQKRKAYVAVNPKAKQCAIVFQGSQTALDWARNMDGGGVYMDIWPGLDEPFAPPPKKRMLRGDMETPETAGDAAEITIDQETQRTGVYGLPPNPNNPNMRTFGVFPGFVSQLLGVTESENWELWRKMYRSAQKKTKVEGVNVDCTGGVFITGHSQGGAMATLHKLAHFGEDSNDAKVVIFGSPKPIKEGFNDCSGERYYITSVDPKINGDPVSGLNPFWLHGHTGVNLQMQEGGEEWQAITRGCPQNKNTKDEAPPNLNLESHAMRKYAYAVYKTQMENKYKGGFKAQKGEEEREGKDVDVVVQ
eukprot:GDKI01046425.1.p1 GENE.GDKI01046425.1~~GDKI01046425.1.p1  ORF type:complete len:342 (-),score=91.81 GDKI01046425.1:23-1048(-)